jgi:hypothetical protein
MILTDFVHNFKHPILCWGLSILPKFFFNTTLLIIIMTTSTNTKWEEFASHFHLNPKYGYLIDPKL